MQEVDQVAQVNVSRGCVDHRRVAVLEADVVGVGIERELLAFEDGSCLIGGGFLLLGRSGQLRVGNGSRGGLIVVVDGAGRYDAAGCRLRIDRPVGLKAIVEIERGQPGVEAAAVGNRCCAGIHHVGVAGQLAYGRSVVGVMQNVHCVVGVFGSGGDIELRRHVELIFCIGLSGVGPEGLVELGQRLIGPAVGRASAEDAEL